MRGLRAVIPAALAYAVAKGWIGESQVADITTAVITLAAAGWSVKTNMGAKPASPGTRPGGAIGS